MRLWWAIWL